MTTDKAKLHFWVVSCFVASSFNAVGGFVANFSAVSADEWPLSEAIVRKMSV